MGWPAGRCSSRGRAGQRRHVGEEQGTNLEEQGRSRTGGRRSRTSGGRLGDEQGKRLEEQGGRRAPFYSPAPPFRGRARAWPCGIWPRSPIWRGRFGALALALASPIWPRSRSRPPTRRLRAAQRASAPPSADSAPNSRLVDA